VKADSVTNYNFEDLMPNLNEFWKEQNGLGSCSIYRIGEDYYMLYGSSCSACNPCGPVIFKLNKNGDQTDSLQEFKDYDNVEEIIRFNIPERLSKNYLQVKI
jgi:hypothetical protein